MLAARAAIGIGAARTLALLLPGETAGREEALARDAVRIPATGPGDGQRRDDGSRDAEDEVRP
jgi:hypothetical protein